MHFAIADSGAVLPLPELSEVCELLGPASVVEELYRRIRAWEEDTMAIDRWG